MNLIGYFNENTSPQRIRWIMADILRYAIYQEGITLGEARSIWQQAGYNLKDWASYQPIMV